MNAVESSPARAIIRQFFERGTKELRRADGTAAVVTNAIAQEIRAALERGQARWDGERLMMDPSAASDLRARLQEHLDGALRERIGASAIFADRDNSDYARLLANLPVAFDPGSREIVAIEPEHLEEARSRFATLERTTSVRDVNVVYVRSIIDAYGGTIVREHGGATALLPTRDGAAAVHTAVQTARIPREHERLRALRAAELGYGLDWFGGEFDANAISSLASWSRYEVQEYLRHAERDARAKTREQREQLVSAGHAALRGHAEFEARAYAGRDARSQGLEPSRIRQEREGRERQRDAARRAREPDDERDAIERLRRGATHPERELSMERLSEHLLAAPLRRFLRTYDEVAAKEIGASIEDRLATGDVELQQAFTDLARALGREEALRRLDERDRKDRTTMPVTLTRMAQHLGVDAAKLRARVETLLGEDAAMQLDSSEGLARSTIVRRASSSLQLYVDAVYLNASGTGAVRLVRPEITSVIGADPSGKTDWEVKSVEELAGFADARTKRSYEDGLARSQREEDPRRAAELAQKAEAALRAGVVAAHTKSVLDIKRGPWCVVPLSAITESAIGITAMNARAYQGGGPDHGMWRSWSRHEIPVTLIGAENGLRVLAELPKTVLLRRARERDQQQAAEIAAQQRRTYVQILHDDARNVVEEAKRILRNAYHQDKVPVVGLRHLKLSGDPAKNDELVEHRYAGPIVAVGDYTVAQYTAGTIQTHLLESLGRTPAAGEFWEIVHRERGGMSFAKNIRELAETTIGDNRDERIAREHAKFLIELESPLFERSLERCLERVRAHDDLRGTHIERVTGQHLSGTVEGIVVAADDRVAILHDGDANRLYAFACAELDRAPREGERLKVTRESDHLRVLEHTLDNEDLAQRLALLGREENGRTLHQRAALDMAGAITHHALRAQNELKAQDADGRLVRTVLTTQELLVCVDEVGRWTTVYRWRGQSERARSEGGTPLVARDEGSVELEGIGWGRLMTQRNEMVIEALSHDELAAYALEPIVAPTIPIFEHGLERMADGAPREQTLSGIAIGLDLGRVGLVHVDPRSATAEYYLLEGNEVTSTIADLAHNEAPAVLKAGPGGTWLEPAPEREMTTVLAATEDLRRQLSTGTHHTQQRDRDDRGRGGIAR